MHPQRERSDERSRKMNDCPRTQVGMLAYPSLNGRIVNEDQYDPRRVLSTKTLQILARASIPLDTRDTVRLQIEEKMPGDAPVSYD
jgi:hypothetical protein